MRMAVHRIVLAYRRHALRLYLTKLLNIFQNSEELNVHIAKDLECQLGSKRRCLSVKYDHNTIGPVFKKRGRGQIELLLPVRA
ncbi:unnamed protein product [Soboliphyme baturini]|uniref:Complex 1 LYR protein n=1 Tax=Soboliphyme baturini TaxID=241478 RepID=A0A183INX1_9BILA|nr:unnamed protein product [Soboliphyme baturini]